VAQNQKKTRSRSNFFWTSTSPLWLGRVVLCVMLASIITTTPVDALTYFDAQTPGESQTDDAQEDGDDIEIDPIIQSLYLVAHADDDEMIRVYEIGTLKDPVAGHNIIAYQVKGIPLLPRGNVVFPLRFVGMRLRGPRIMTVNISHHGLLYIRHNDEDESDAAKIKGKRPIRIKAPGLLDVLFALGAVTTMVVLLRRRGIAKKRHRRKVKVRSDVIIG